MKATLITYSLKKTDPTARTQIERELHGYKDYSNMGKHTYQRKGLLQTIPHLKPTRATIIAPTKHAKKILELLRKYKATTQIYPITIAKAYLITKS